MARRLYARQLLLGEIGESGQERLLASGFHRGADGDAGACAVAAEYLQRAGCAAEEDGAELFVPNANAVTAFAGCPALRDAAAMVMGAFAAVEHLKEVLGVAAAREFPTELCLSTEI